jgi:hypothetical protein
MKCAIVRELDSLDRLVRLGGNLNCTVVQSLDLGEADLPWKASNAMGLFFWAVAFQLKFRCATSWTRARSFFQNLGTFHTTRIVPNFIHARS